MATIPSIAMIPSGVKASKLYSVLPTDGTGDFTTTRASVATRVNENGLIEEVASNVPRLDYSDGGCPSLLLEGTATNLITYSENFSDASWQKVDCSITSNSAVSPDGTLNASKYTSTGIDPYVQEYVSSTSITNSLSIWVKGVGSTIGKTCKILAVRDSYAETTNQTFTLTSEWQRIEASLTFSVAPTSTVGFRFDAPDNAVIGDEVLIWGAQFEENSYSTSYIKNEGTALGVTRTADTATGSGSSTVINSTEGVLYFEGSALDDSGGFRAISLSDGVSNRLYIAYHADSNKISALLNSVTIDYVIADVTEYIKVAFKYKVNDFALWINGVEVNTATVGATLPSGTLTQMQFNSGFGGSHFYGKTKSVQVYTSALSDAELTTLTTI